jgi:hypothetical protein
MQAIVSGGMCDARVCVCGLQKPWYVKKFTERITSQVECMTEELIRQRQLRGLSQQCEF